MRLSFVELANVRGFQLYHTLLISSWKVDVRKDISLLNMFEVHLGTSHRKKLVKLD